MFWSILFQHELFQAQEKIRDLECCLKFDTQLYTEEATLHNNSFVKFYTGLPNGAILKAGYEFIAPTESSKLSKLTPFQELMMTLIKNLSMQNLAYRFNISCSILSVVSFYTILDIGLEPLVLWPDHEVLRRTMPDCFKAVTT